MPTSTLENIAAQLEQVCDRHQVRRLRLFGSIARGDQRPDSDVDILVDYESGYTPTFFSMDSLEKDLSPLFDGRTIDLMRPDDVHWFIRRSVLASARTLYEKRSPSYEMAELNDCPFFH